MTREATQRPTGPTNQHPHSRRAPRRKTVPYSSLGNSRQVIAAVLPARVTVNSLLSQTSQAPSVTPQPTQAGSMSAGRMGYCALELGVNWPHLLVAQPPVRRDPVTGMSWAHGCALRYGSTYTSKSRWCLVPQGSGGVGSGDPSRTPHHSRVRIRSSTRYLGDRTHPSCIGTSPAPVPDAIGPDSAHDNVTCVPAGLLLPLIHAFAACASIANRAAACDAS